MCRRLAVRQDQIELIVLALECIAQHYRCQDCGEKEFPVQRYCSNCGSKNPLFEEDIYRQVFGTMDFQNPKACAEGHAAEALAREGRPQFCVDCGMPC